MNALGSHFGPDGEARMVDVTAKPVTCRQATASAKIEMAAQTARLIREGKAVKGDVLSVARLAGIAATKWTSHLIPLCHPIAIEAVEIEFRWQEDEPERRAALSCTATLKTSGKTGIEMEAMTAVSVAALTVYDMAKSVDRGIEIGPIRLESKDGGKSGRFVRGE